MRLRRGAWVTDGHASGHFSATFNQWLDLCDQFAERGCVRFTVTEAGGKTAREALQHWAYVEGWDVVHFTGRGAGECAILSDPRALVVEDSEVVQLTNLTLDTARKAPLHAPVGRYRHLGVGAVDWRSVAHLPAHLEGVRGFKRGKPARVHAAAVAGWKQAMHGKRPRTITFDANLNLRRPWVREWLTQRFPGMANVWGTRLPKAGTFHRRIIDLVLTHLRYRRPRLLDPSPGFDHRGFTFRVRLARRRGGRA